MRRGGRSAAAPWAAAADEPMVGRRLQRWVGEDVAAWRAASRARSVWPKASAERARRAASETWTRARRNHRRELCGGLDVTRGAFQRHSASRRASGAEPHKRTRGSCAHEGPTYARQSGLYCTRSRPGAARGSVAAVWPSRSAAGAGVRLGVRREQPQRQLHRELCTVPAAARRADDLHRDPAAPPLRACRAHSSQPADVSRARSSLSAGPVQRGARRARRAPSRLDNPRTPLHPTSKTTRAPRTATPISASSPPEAQAQHARCRCAGTVCRPRGAQPARCHLLPPPHAALRAAGAAPRPAAASAPCTAPRARKLKLVHRRLRLVHRRLKLVPGRCKLVHGRKNSAPSPSDSEPASHEPVKAGARLAQRDVP